MRSFRAAILLSAALTITPLSSRAQFTAPATGRGLTAPLTEKAAGSGVDTLFQPPKYERVIVLDSAHQAWARAAFLDEVSKLRAKEGLTSKPIEHPAFDRSAQKRSNHYVHATIGDIRRDGHFYAGANDAFIQLATLRPYSKKGEMAAECIVAFSDRFDPLDSVQLTNHARYAAWDLTTDSTHNWIINTPLTENFKAGVEFILREQHYPNTPSFMDGNVTMMGFYHGQISDETARKINSGNDQRVAKR